MRTLPELAKAYDPSEAEGPVRDAWAAAKAFASDPDAPGDPYSIVIPPPNVTAALHLGHALNNTIQDVLTRYHRMRGYNTLWMPGTDHAGIATQTVVEKRLLQDGVKRLDLGREAFVERVQGWKDEYEQVILGQLDEMGASCDTDRTRFTMDEVCASAVRHAFFELFRDGLIYRGKRLVNWDPVTRTALSDDEVEMEEIDGHMWYLRYPLTDGSGHVTVATTRPETMLGDTAVALHPDDPRAAEVSGKTVTMPITGRVIPIVEDDYVVMADPDGDGKAQLATGFLKVTPAHDPNDWDIGLRHDLDVINVMAPDGSISDEYGWHDVSDEARAFIGMSREDARTAIVDWFDTNGLLDEVRDHSHAVGHSYRSHVPIEPYLSDQWYVAVTDDRLRGAALRAMVPDQRGDLPDGISPAGDTPGDGELRFHPDRYARTFYQWHENIRDWCISRQLWWGHRIPVWVRVVPAADAVDTWTERDAAYLSRELPEGIEESVCVPAHPSEDLIAALEAAGFEQDPDVLDTWFSSGLWPMSTMGWPEPERYPETAGLLDRYNPTSTLTTAREIITLWVSRMVMFNRYFMGGQLPYRDVFIHAMIQDGHGQKMSKSLGNGVDPRDIIATHGADAMRFTLVQMTTSTQDVRMPVDLICPHSGESFTPEFITTPAGHVVAAPIQTSPKDPNRSMVSAYGAATGEVEPSDDRPLALNTSSKFDSGRNFANKIWNANRFALGVLGRATDSVPAEPVVLANRPLVDRWIMSRLATTVDQIERALGEYQFNVVADTLYATVWHDVCDWYLEAIKPTVDDDAEQRVVLGQVLDTVLRSVHIVCPFVTEALWSHVASAIEGTVDGVSLPESDLAASAAWPTMAPSVVDADAEAAFERARSLVLLIRNLRGERKVKPKQKLTLHAPDAVVELISAGGGIVETLAGLETVVALTDDRPSGASALAFEGAEVLVTGLVDAEDVGAERARLDGVIAEKTKQIAGFEGRLANESYVAKAPEHLVQETRDQLAAAQADLAAATSALASLG